MRSKSGSKSTGSVRKWIHHSSCGSFRRRSLEETTFSWRISLWCIIFKLQLYTPLTHPCIPQLNNLLETLKNDEKGHHFPEAWMPCADFRYIYSQIWEEQSVKQIEIYFKAFLRLHWITKSWWWCVTQMFRLLLLPTIPSTLFYQRVMFGSDPWWADGMYLLPPADNWRLLGCQLLLYTVSFQNPSREDI